MDRIPYKNLENEDNVNESTPKSKSEIEILSILHKIRVNRSQDYEEIKDLVKTSTLLLGLLLIIILIVIIIKK